MYYLDAMENALFSNDNAPYKDNAIARYLWDWAKEYGDDGAENLVLWSLESISCACGHAPSGFMYNCEIAAKYVDWWNHIDEALHEYNDATGEKFAPETTGELVWFAVEWFSHEMAKFLRSNSDFDDWESQTNDPDEDEFLSRFNKDIAPMVIEQFGENDEPAMNEAFCNWVDSLNKAGEISDYFAETITLD